MGTFVCFLCAFVLALLITLSDGQGNQGATFSGSRARGRPFIPRPAGTTMSPEQMQIAMRNKAFLQKRQNMAANPNNNNNPNTNNNNVNNNNNNNNNNNTNQSQGTSNNRGQSQGSWSRPGNNRGNSMNLNNMMFCPNHNPGDCPEIPPPRPGCWSQEISIFMGRTCRGCPFDICERNGVNPSEMMKDMYRMGINPMQYMNQMNPMNNMNPMNSFQQAMYYDSSFLENMPPWMLWNFNQNNGGGGSGSGGGSNSGSGAGSGSGGSGGGGGTSGNNMGGGQTQGSGGEISPFEQYMWLTHITK